MKTRITEILNIKHPIVLAAMAWVTNAEMVAAISEAGGLGTIGPNAGARVVTRDVQETGERLRKQIQSVKKLTDKPFAVNFVVSAGGLEKKFSECCMKVAMEERVPVAIVSQGSPSAYTKQLQEAGMKVIHVCASVTHALKAQKAGVDAIVASGTEGGGHSGFDQNTTFCLVPQVTRAVKIPVIAGGGIADGRQLTAALALGAEGVYVGTRFIATRECPAHETFKKVIVNSKDGDTVSIRHGMVAKPGTGNREFTDERRGSLRMVLTDKIREILIQKAGHIDFNDLSLGQDPVPMEKGGSATAAALIYGDPSVPFWAAGQSVGLIDEIISCAEVIKRMMAEAEQARQNLANMS
ncbi:MAG TPA: nitronate monooxygenase [Smithellaceae bacterium]|nr:nitronate monooxygenase [Smithellaceae bacterium]